MYTNTNIWSDACVRGLDEVVTQAGVADDTGFLFELWPVFVSFAINVITVTNNDIETWCVLHCFIVYLLWSWGVNGGVKVEMSDKLKVKHKYGFGDLHQSKKYFLFYCSILVECVKIVCVTYTSFVLLRYKTLSEHYYKINLYPKIASPVNRSLILQTCFIWIAVLMWQ